MLGEAIHFMTTDHKFKTQKLANWFFQHNPLSGGKTVIVALRPGIFYIFQYFGREKENKNMKEI